MLTLIMAIMLSTSPDHNVNAPWVNPPMVTHYKNKGTIKARNRWDVLNFSPNGVEIAPMVIVKPGKLHRF